MRLTTSSLLSRRMRPMVPSQSKPISTIFSSITTIRRVHALREQWHPVHDVLLREVRRRRTVPDRGHRVSERQRLLSELATGLDSYEKLANEVSETRDTLASDVSSDWEDRALSEITTSGTDRIESTVSRSTFGRSPKRKSSRRRWKTTFSDYACNQDPPQCAHDTIESAIDEAADDDPVIPLVGRRWLPPRYRRTREHTTPL